jgi:hypothetical protein
VSEPASGAAATPARPASDRWWLAAVAVLAFVVRLSPVLSSGGLGFIGRYDDGVYYSAADALSFGRVPYRQFVLLHPPGLMLLLVPFAVLGRATSDLTGMEVARIAFMLVGALTAVLVARIARRWGWAAMIVAGAFYACWQPAVFAEQSTFLEPIGGLLVVLALSRLLNTTDPPSPRADLLAGLFLGAAATVKIWYVAPWAVIVLWQLVVRRPKAAGRIFAAGVAAVAVVVVPFAVLAGGRMFDMVVRDQLARPVEAASRLGRISGLVGVHGLTVGQHELRSVLTVVLVVLVAVVVATVLRDRAARPLVALLAVEVFVVMLSPVFLRHYASFIAAPLALVVGISVARAFRLRRWRRFGPAVLAVALLASLGSAVAIGFTDRNRGFPVHRFAMAAPAGCIAADDPLALVEIDRLSSEFRAGCKVDIDVSGALLDRLDLTYANGRLVPRTDNPGWQAYLRDYLTGARAFILCRARADGIFGPVYQSYLIYPLLAEGDGGRDQLRLVTGLGVLAPG